MSEPREECYKCLNSSNCILIADYGSIYCMTHRKFNMNSNDIHKEWERKAKKYDEVLEKLEADKMEQFDDYVIYLIESYLAILKGEKEL